MTEKTKKEYKPTRVDINDDDDDGSLTRHMTNISLYDRPSRRDTCQGDLKMAIRTKIWDLMEKRNFVKDYPRPCHNKIPNFKRCGVAATKLSRLREFKKAKCVKINPSLAQMHLRFLTLQHGKTLYVPSPSLSEDFMYEVDPKLLKRFWQLKRASSKAGSKELGRAITTQEKIKIDLFVVASVACSPNGVRLGKGMGYAEMEWAVLYTMGAVTKNTTVVTTVHDCQVLSEKKLPTSLLATHDLPVDIIVTPTRIINVRQKLRKPITGVLWDLVTEEQLESMPVLKELV